MNQQTVFSAIRSLMTLVGTFVIGINLFGRVVDASIWKEVGGAVLALAGIILGLTSKTETSDALQSGVRSLIMSVGAIMVAYGKMTGQTVTAILGIVPSLMPFLQSYLHRTAVANIATGTVVPTTDGKLTKAPPKIAMILLLCMIGMAGQSQSLFHSIPKPVVAKTNPFARSLSVISDTLMTGSDYKGLRFTGPTVMYAVNSKDINSSAIFTFVGIDYENDYWDAVSQKFYTRYAIGIQAGEGGQIAPKEVSAVTAISGTFSTQKIGVTLLPFKLTIGVIYNFSTRSTMLGVGPGIPLNN